MYAAIHRMYAAAYKNQGGICMVVQKFYNFSKVDNFLCYHVNINSFSEVECV